MQQVDVAIAGGGPAGLSAALMLGRCCRRVIVIDAGETRNRHAAAIHGFLTRDGTAPADLIRAARADLETYPTVEVRPGMVTQISGMCGAFVVRTAAGEEVGARRVLLATGVTDVVPGIPGLAELYGRSVHHCAHCDGFEYQGQPIGVYGQAAVGVEAALAMLAWSEDIVLLTDGRPLTAPDRALCELQGVRIREERIAGLEGDGGRLERVVFDGGPPLPRAALFIVAGQRQHSELARSLGCEINDQGVVVTDEHEISTVPGVYVAGNAAVGEQLIVVAVAQGVVAATAIHANLWVDDLRERAVTRSRRSHRSNS